MNRSFFQDNKISTTEHENGEEFLFPGRRLKLAFPLGYLSKAMVNIFTRQRFRFLHRSMQQAVFDTKLSFAPVLLNSGRRQQK